MRWDRPAPSSSRRQVQGFPLVPLDEVIRNATPATIRRTRVDVHVGSLELGDVREAGLMHESACISGLKLNVHLHANRSHNLVGNLRDEGHLDRMLRQVTFSARGARICMHVYMHTLMVYEYSKMLLEGLHCTLHARARSRGREGRYMRLSRSDRSRHPALGRR